MTLMRGEVAAMVDHTVLRPEATADDAVRAATVALQVGACAVCVSPSLVAAAGEVGVRVATVCGFPSGAHEARMKAAEAAWAVEAGAAEVDMVLDLGAVAVGAWSRVRDEIAAVRTAVGGGVVLKVIVESACHDRETLERCCACAVEAGADFVKTSTGFHPAGGASPEAVRVMAAAVAGHGLGVKASGGIRTAEQAASMIAAGATRLGLSASEQVLAGFAG